MATLRLYLIERHDCLITFVLHHRITLPLYNCHRPLTNPFLLSQSPYLPPTVSIKTLFGSYTRLQ